MLRYLETTISDRKPENTRLFSLVKAWENRNTTQASKKQLQRKSKQFSCPLRMDINCNEKDSAQIQKKIVPRYHPRSAGTDQLEKSWGFKKCFYNHLSRMMEVELIFLLWSSPSLTFCDNYADLVCTQPLGFSEHSAGCKDWQPQGDPGNQPRETLHPSSFHYRQASVSPNISLWLLLMHMQFWTTNNNFIIIFIHSDDIFVEVVTSN